MENNVSTPILIGSDHAGYPLKLQVIEHLKEIGYTPIDVGNDSLDSCDYPVFANRLCVGIKEGKAPLGMTFRAASASSSAERASVCPWLPTSMTASVPLAARTPSAHV